MGLALVVVVAVGACTSAAEEPELVTGSPRTTMTTPTAGPELYVMLMWHQHQPLYPKDANGVYTRPWVRVHATKDYWDMAAMVEDFPDITFTVNLTPVLLLQLEDLAAGATDLYWEITGVPAAELSAEQHSFLLERFFDVNPKVMERFPRYGELAAKRGDPDGFTTQDLLDLQVLWNLAWTDPRFLATDPLAELVGRQRDYREGDKEVVLEEHRRIVAEVIDLHARLWAEGRIEIATSPLAHPILPLVADTDLATVGDPSAVLPTERFSRPGDADLQVAAGLEVAERLLGRRPVGMWPGEGAVAQDVMGFFSKHGVQWVATGEDVLARSLDIGSFTRDNSDLVAEGDLLYRPWSATLRRNPDVAMFFRDNLISDRIGFEYSGMDASAAADDIRRRLADIRDSLDTLGEGGLPPVVSVILDGENAWEHYPNDGIDFLEAFYSVLSEVDWIETITPSTYVERFGPPEPLDHVFGASWFQPNFATWIGETEEATAWDYLARVRRHLAEAEAAGHVSDDALTSAIEAMLFAEGSDWFWWYGDDQDSGDDAYFDRAFRELLGQVYDALGDPRPGFLEVPIVAERPEPADVTPDGDMSVVVDGRLDDWEGAGRYHFDAPAVVEVWWGFDDESLHLAVPDVPAWEAGRSIELYLGVPGVSEAAASGYDGRPLGFGWTHAVVWDGVTARVCPPSATHDPEACFDIVAAMDEGAVEMSIPLAMVGSPLPGAVLVAKADTGSGRFPGDGPMAFQVPAPDIEPFLEVVDPSGDDHGPGTYTYPTDAVFAPGGYDLARFAAAIDGDDLVLVFDLVAPITNPWGSPRGLSIQTFDVYVDVDPGAGTGSRMLLAGRNAALGTDMGWERAVTIEGWEPALFEVTDDGTISESTPSFVVNVFGPEGRVVARLPRALFPSGDPATWGYAVVVLSQEGFPSAGVRRVRDLEPDAQQWRLGGGSGVVNQTRVIDVAWPEEGSQEEWLSDHPPADSLDGLGPDDFGKVPILVAPSPVP